MNWRLREVWKFFRVLLQIAAIACLAWGFFLLVHERRRPVEPDRGRWTQRRGFVAISFTALARTEHEHAVSRQRFRKHLAALKEDGWTSVTTADLVAFYRDGRPLPEKALYLMFENGRKDNAIFGQDGLAENGYRATLYMPTGRMEEWNRLVLGAFELSRLSKSPFWEVGSQGHDFRPINLTPDGFYSYFLTDYLRDEYNRPRESPAQFQERLRQDYDASVERIRSLTGTPPSAYLFMPGNTLWNSLDPEVERVNGDLLRERFALVFAGNGPCFNGRETHPLDLTRMQVQETWSADRLLAEIRGWLPTDRVYRQEEDSVGSYWRVDRGRLEQGNDALTLVPERGRPPFAWLRGSVRTANAEIETGLESGADGAAFCYLRYAGRESHLRVERRGSMLRVQERIPRRGLVTMYEAPWPDDARRLRITLKGNRLRLALDGRELVDQGIPVNIALRYGRIALGGEGADGEALRFAGLRISPIAERWADLPASAETRAWRELAADPEVTGVMIPVGGTAAGGVPDEALPAMLLAVARGGSSALAVLPAGVSDLAPLSGPLAHLPAALTDRLWSGALFTATDQPDWALLSRAMERAAEGALAVGLRLGPAAAGDFAKRLRARPPLPRPPASYLVLTDSASLAPADLIALRHAFEQVFTADADMPAVYRLADE